MKRLPGMDLPSRLMGVRELIQKTDGTFVFRNGFSLMRNMPNTFWPLG